ADDQIRETLVGSNILGSASGGSYAASKEQNRVREDVAMTDETILKSLIDQAIDAFVSVNGYTKPVSVELKDVDDINKDLSDRDLNIFKMSGEKFRPTQEYLEETYKIKLEEVPQISVQNMLPNTMRFTNSDPLEDHLSKQLPSAEKTQPAEEEIVQQIEQIFETVQSYDEAFDALAAHYVSFDAPQLEAMLSDYIANAHLYGLAEVEDENPKG
ncbi:MAG: DUF935 domain-containing protein, partial [Sulfurovum sp.]|nr:DUF935 domain-containing protein [Sulfurovum sp.]